MVFVLVHGAWHGAWCWELVVPELETRGHSAVAMDMPIDVADATWSDYADAVTHAIPDDADAQDLVLVGHSMGGLVIPTVAERRPVSKSVFLASLLPVEPSLAEMITTHPDVLVPGMLDNLVNDADGSTSWRTEDAVARFYADCSPDVGEDAASKLRKQYMTNIGDPFPIERFPKSPSTYIVCTQDRAVDPAAGRAAAERFGMDVLEINASHSPFLSRAGELAEMLVSL